jgi:hypothetical protein
LEPIQRRQQQNQGQGHAQTDLKTQGATYQSHRSPFLPLWSANLYPQLKGRHHAGAACSRYSSPSYLSRQGAMRPASIRGANSARQVTRLLFFFGSQQECPSNKKGPRRALCTLTEVGRSPPRIPHLLEDRHDLIDYCAERADGILSRFDQVSTLLGMQVEERKFASFIFLDHHRSVASTTGS